MKAHTLMMLMQLFSLNHQDVYSYTIPYLHTSTFTYNGFICNTQLNSYGNTEANPISAWMFGKNLTDAPFIVGSIGELGITSLLSDFDNQHLKGFPIGTADIFLSLVTWAEINAIHTWASWGRGPKEKQWTLARIEF